MFQNRYIFKSNKENLHPVPVPKSCFVVVYQTQNITPSRNKTEDLR